MKAFNRKSVSISFVLLNITLTGCFYGPQPVQEEPLVSIPDSQEIILLSSGEGVDNQMSYQSSISPDGRWAVVSGLRVDSTQVYDLDADNLLEKIEYRVDLLSGERVPLNYESLLGGASILGTPRIYNDGDLLAYVSGEQTGIIKIDPVNNSITQVNVAQDGLTLIPVQQQTNNNTGMESYVVSDAEGEKIVLVSSYQEQGAVNGGVVDIYIKHLGDGSLQHIPLGLDMSTVSNFYYTASADLSHFLIYAENSSTAEGVFLLVDDSGVVQSLENLQNKLTDMGVEGSPQSMLISNDGGDIGLSVQVLNDASSQEMHSIIYNVFYDEVQDVYTEDDYPALSYQGIKEFSITQLNPYGRFSFPKHISFLSLALPDVNNGVEIEQILTLEFIFSGTHYFIDRESGVQRNINQDQIVLYALNSTGVSADGEKIVVPSVASLTLSDSDLTVFTQTIDDAVVVNEAYLSDIYLIQNRDGNVCGDFEVALGELHEQLLLIGNKKLKKKLHAKLHKLTRKYNKKKYEKVLEIISSLENKIEAKRGKKIDEDIAVASLVLLEDMSDSLLAIMDDPECAKITLH